MARGARKGPELLSLDMRGTKIQNLGRSTLLTEPDGAARLDDIPGYYEYNPEPVGIANPGDDARVSHGNHVHGPGEATVYKGKLWTSYVQDPYAKGAVDAMYLGWDSCGAGFLFTDGWIEGPAGTWTRNSTGAMASAFFDDVVPYADMLVLAWSNGLVASELKYAGLYELVNPGDVGVKAVMRRVDGFNLSANYVNGMWFTVTGGTVHAGEFWQLTIPDPFVLNITDQAWASVSEPADASSKELLSAIQIGRASSATVVGSTNVANGGSDTLVECTTTGGILSGQTLVAGQPWECHLKVGLTVDDPAATTLVRAYLASTSGAFVLLAESAPIHNEAYETIVFPGALASNYEIPVGEEVRIRFRAYSTSVGAVEVNFIYNESDHPSWIQTPMELGVGGVHNDLSGRDAVDCHPAGSIGAGRLHTPFGAATLVDGYLTMPDRNDCIVTIGESTIVLGIATAGWAAGDKIWLTFIGLVEGGPGCELRHGYDTSGAPGFSPMYLTHDGADPQDINWRGIYPQSNGRVCLQLRTDDDIDPSPCWQLIAGPEA